MDLTESRSETSHRHFWELSRADSILAEAGDLKGLACLDFGAGDLYFAEKTFQLSGRKVTAFDPLASYDINDTRMLATNKLAAVQENAPYDRIFLLDVLEHVEKESELIKDLKGLLKPDGLLLVTVPAFQFLFSDHDTFLKHYRRYDQKQLLNVLKSNGLSVERSWYFYNSLFTIRLIQKLIPKTKANETGQEGIGGWAYPATHIVTRILRAVLNVDYQVCKLLAKVGIRLPGLSLFALCKKTSA